MLLQPSPDQSSFRDTTAKFLTDQVPVDVLRRLRNDPAGYAPDYWRRGVELGWTSLLVDEKHGGGSLSGDGIVDLSLIAYEFGAHASPGPLVPASIVAAALSAADAHADVLAGLLDGSALGTWCFSEQGSSLTVSEHEIRVDGDELVVNGVKRPVESADQATHLLVTGRTGDGLSQVLLPKDTPGITITPMQTVDLTRRFAVVAFDEVRVPTSSAVGELGQAAAAVDKQLQYALALIIAESVGAMQTAFGITLQWVFDRYSFGRPLASYQAIKHRFADMKASLEASHGLSDDAAAAVAAGSPRAAALLSAAKAYIGDYGSELLQECVQFHGGLGVTFEHDIHLYLRRHTVNRALFGTPAEHRQRLTNLIEKAEVA